MKCLRGRNVEKNGPINLEVDIKVDNTVFALVTHSIVIPIQNCNYSRKKNTKK